MNTKTLFFYFVSTCFLVVLNHVPVFGSPVKMKTGFFDPHNPDKSLAFPDFLLPRTEYPIRPKVCSYKGKEYSDGTVVTTEEPCLKCKCMGGSLICYLRVCPMLPDPPPPQCVLVLRRGACCSELVCEDSGVATNHISRADTTDLDHQIDSTISFNDGRGCIENGTLYASGSAMSTSTLCEYCYCISGAQKCVKPKCLLPVPGCTPTRSPHSCCPVSYNCTSKHVSTTTTLSAIHSRTGCYVNGIFYPDGDRILSKESPCTNCFCIRGHVKCANLSCAPPLLGCTPIIEPGKCCAGRYDCSQRKASNERDKITSNSVKYDNQNFIINERSFPGDTLLTPAQIAEILLGSEKRSTRNNASDKQKQDKKNSVISVSIITTPEEVPQIIKNTSTPSDSKEVIKDDNRTPNLTKPAKDDDSKAKPPNPVMKESEDEPKVVKTNQSHIKNNDSTSNTDEQNQPTLIRDKIDDNTTSDDDYTSISEVVINDSINCSTEISYTDGEIANNSTESITKEDGTESILTFNDTQERRPILSHTIDADTSFDGDEDIIHENSTKIRVGSQFPSHSLIIPKDDDVYMVNVSTFVRTNTSIVTLRPVAAIPPEIEAILNMSTKNEKDDYFDYDYKSSLPPSLPNLEIIPFLATDAVVKEKKAEKKKTNKYDNVYTPPETKTYLETFSPGTAERYNGTVYPYVTTPFMEEKITNYNRNPVYKQHINDKFSANSNGHNSRPGGVQYAQKKNDDVLSLNPETSAPVYDINVMNMFSPPVKTEGGFLPRDPSIDSFYGFGFPSTGESSFPVTGTSLQIDTSEKNSGDNCISNGKEYKNKELITDPHACVVCYCYYGDIHCQDPECPPIKTGCRRIVEKSSSSCCGIEICNDEPLVTLQTTKAKAEEKIIKSTTYSPVFKASVSTEAIKFSTTKENKLLSTNKISTTAAPKIIEKVATVSTYVVPSKVHKVTTESPKTTPSSTTTTTTEKLDGIVSVNLQDRHPEHDFGEKIFNSNESKKVIAPTKQPTVAVPEYTENMFFKETMSDSYESDPFSDDNADEDDGFSFDSVLKYLLGEDPTTKPPPRLTSKIFTTSLRPTTKLMPSSDFVFSSTPHSTTPYTRVFSTSARPSSIVSTESTTKYTPTEQTTSLRTTPSPTPFRTKYTTTTLQTPFYKNPNKFTYTKSPRNETTTQQYRNITKIIRLTTKAPLIYSTIQRFTKPKFSPTPFPLTTESFKKIAPPSYIKEHFQSPHKKKPSSSDSTLPFSSGLLKLAGCNIYGRMYRVGKIIAELSGPCLQCMCTEIGVQCKTLYIANC